MLTRLSISNYALIDSLTIDFHQKLNSVTGETGAGKSIILGALGLILGNRADLSVLKDPAKKCIVEGIFEIGNYNLQLFLRKMIWIMIPQPFCAAKLHLPANSGHLSTILL
jgi:DNA repair protein RecN (Recombination protein N)